MKATKAINTTEISLKEAEHIIRNTKGKVFSVCFYKKDGSLRTLQGRLGVHKDIKGKGSTVAKHSEYICVYEMHNNYRNVNLNTISSVTFGKIKYKVTTDETKI